MSTAYCRQASHLLTCRRCWPTRPMRTRGRVSPSGRPSTARRWFWNCEVSLPSIVQWPELCTRGASSLASSRAVAAEQFEREHADIVERFGQRPRMRDRRCRPSACETGAGARLADSTPSTCQFCVSGQARNSPSRPRTATTRQLRGRTRRSLRGSAHRGRLRAERVPRRIGIGGRLRGGTGPCRRSPVGGS